MTWNGKTWTQNDLKWIPRKLLKWPFSLLNLEFLPIDPKFKKTFLYNQCRPTYQPCDQFTVSSGCKIEIITYVENMKNSVCVFVVFIAAIWFLILLKVHLLTWCLKKFGYTSESRCSGNSDSQSRSTEQTKMEGEFDANNKNNNNNKSDRHVYRRNRNSSGEERRNGNRNLAMGEEIKTKIYRPPANNIIFGTKDTHDRVGEYVRSHAIVAENLEWLVLIYSRNSISII